MKKLILLAVFFATPAHAGQCLIKPIPPLGCSNANAICMCDAAGYCEWVFACR